MRERRVVERDQLLARITNALERDARIAAAWLAGSIGRGTEDWLSDLDLWIAVHDGAMPDLRADPRRFVTSIASPVLIIDEPANAPPSGAYLFTLFAGETGPHQVDWYWLPVASETRPARTRLLFDHARIAITAPPPSLTDEEARERLTLLLHNFIALAAIAGKLKARGWTLPAARNLGTVHQLLAEIEWIIEHNTAPEYDDIKECVRDIPVPVSCGAALAELMHLLVRAESLQANLSRRGVEWPVEAAAQVRTHLTLLVGSNTPRHG